MFTKLKTSFHNKKVAGNISTKLFLLESTVKWQCAVQRRGGVPYTAAFSTSVLIDTESTRNPNSFF